MRDSTFLKAVAMPSILAAYIVYISTNPGTDGALFGSVMLLLGLLAGLKLKEMVPDDGPRL